MRPTARLKLGYYPLPLAEARRLKTHLVLPESPFSALDPCIGDGGAFQVLVEQAPALRYGIELDSFRSEQAREHGISVIQGDALDVQCQVDSLSLVYLNPPYDFEVGKSNNQRMEVVFLRHTGRWLKPGGVLVFVIPQPQLARCAGTLAEHFQDIRVYRLSDPECLKYNQIAILAVRRSRKHRLQDRDLEAQSLALAGFAENSSLAPLPDSPEYRYSIPPSNAAALVYNGLPLDEIEDKLMESSAYRQLRRVLSREPRTVQGKPLTPLHGGHVGLLCTAGMLNGVFGEDNLRHVANWQSRKYTKVWQEEGEGNNVRHIREYFSHECALLWINGTTQVLTHEPEDEGNSEGNAGDEEANSQSATSGNGFANTAGPRKAKVVVMPTRGDRK